ncbi:MAG: AbrB/MazE/SpoVT family DNA-binding domain-containing protein [Pseudomonadaceae bacterium]|nr:AbrB/MazE/SpoVT family DNA-binding domain-containing protein [Pseudomonadaceae bacterium]
MPSRKPNNSIPGRSAKAKPPNASRTATKDALATGERRVRLFRNGRNQALRIPREFELEGDEAILRREGNRLIIEPAPTGSLLSLLAGWEPIDLPLPDIDEDLSPLDDPVIT